MNQDQLKQAVAQAAVAHVSYDAILGVGTGSTVNYFIEALAPIKNKIKAAVSSSEESTKRLQALGIDVVDLNSVSG